MERRKIIARDEKKKKERDGHPTCKIHAVHLHGTRRLANASARRAANSRLVRHRARTLERRAHRNRRQSDGKKGFSW